MNVPSEQELRTSEVKKFLNICNLIPNTMYLLRYFFFRKKVAKHSTLFHIVINAFKNYDNNGLFLTAT